ncbi:hypothetical protein [Pseudorhodoferax sp. Leaf265]|uniref:hypothetical protein n=1 Tax=Pseudorhodoferax sp. Leaf265 TaxID=1736315 RepID=UPI0006F600D1|nr:hypothetical protein [Pseudorhodoferax sp. Leaf265]KQP19955.1 hypothetical protein ASF45_22940 [Pseudorhodoferax sp. Leaf265]
MSKKLVGASVRLFGGAGNSAIQRETIDTVNGAILAGTEGARAYLELKAWVDPLTAIANGIQNMSFDKPQLIADIVELIPRLPESASGIRANLQDLSEALQGRLSNHCGMNFPDAGAAFATHVVNLRSHVDRVTFQLYCVLGDAPRPPNPLAVKPLERAVSRGTWHYADGDY